jgi:hypothetical protein
MITTILKLSEIKENPDNPRKIKKEQLDKLKKSITDFPEMLNMRPIVVDINNVVLGGNMRLLALKELGYTEVPVIKVEELTPDQKKQFIVKDNVNYGEWDWDMLNSANWNLNYLDNWGLDIPKWLNDDDKEPEFDFDHRYDKLNSYLNNKVKQVCLFLTLEQYEDTIDKLTKLMEYEGLESNTEAVLFLIKNYYETDLS